MNAAANANVDVRGDASAKLPLLPWLAGGFLVIGGSAGFIGMLVLIRAYRREIYSPGSSRTSPLGNLSP
jgi:hypothetical protein